MAWHSGDDEFGNPRPDDLEEQGLLSVLVTCDWAEESAHHMNQAGHMLRSVLAFLDHDDFPADEVDRVLDELDDRSNGLSRITAAARMDGPARFRKEPLHPHRDPAGT